MGKIANALKKAKNKVKKVIRDAGKRVGEVEKSTGMSTESYAMGRGFERGMV